MEASLVHDTKGKRRRGLSLRRETPGGVKEYFFYIEVTDPEGGFVIHHVESSLFPNWEGHGQKRYVTLSGNRLTLTSPLFCGAAAGR
ncbi:MAG: hypothetical protein GTN72_16250 [Candidatus Latescibacteria bacterium]|nr:hypothetical protein [Candidatus Latescibacterota bacterium]